MCHSTKSKAFCALIFDDQRPRAAGELLEGEVELFLALLSQNRVHEVYVELRGTVVTKLRLPRSQGSRITQQTVELLRTTTLLWGRETAYTASDGYLKIPFQFTLPSGIPPSCSFSENDDSGQVEYCIRVVGVRPLLFRNLTTTSSFRVLPVSLHGHELSKTLESGWKGNWQTLEKEKDIRIGLTEAYSHAKMTLSFPKLDAYPISTPIPFTVDITTTTKPMKLSDTPPDGKLMFPSPPTSPSSALRFRVERKVQLEANSLVEAHSDIVEYLGGFGAKSKYWHPLQCINLVPLEKVWMPEDVDGCGRWQQHSHFSSNFVLNCAPSFESATMSVDYSLLLRVEFPGDNHLKIECPVDIISNQPVPTVKLAVQVPSMSEAGR